MKDGLNVTLTTNQLFRPRPLELTAADELVAKENISILKENGFEVVSGSSPEDRHGLDPDGGDHKAEHEGGKLHLVAQPVSKNTVFDMKGP